jgi:hypothetical protein
MGTSQKLPSWNEEGNEFPAFGQERKGSLKSIQKYILFIITISPLGMSLSRLLAGARVGSSIGRGTNPA